LIWGAKLVKQLLGAFSIAIMLIGFALASFQPIEAAHTTIIVPDDYPTVQAAIDKAAVGETVYVRSGTYNENIHVDKQLSLIGENKQTTVIDGGGKGTVVQIGSASVEIANFTIRNTGTSQWFGTGFPDSCITVEESNNVAIRNSLVTSATVGVWSYVSSNMNFVQNVVSNVTTMGIVAYACMNSTIRDNLFEDCGVVGVHLDGNSVGCQIMNNTVTDCGEGLEIERSGQNAILENEFLNNNASVILNSCGKSNVLSNNIMNGVKSNLVVWGTTQDAYVQTIDDSNLIDGKKVYYMVNSKETTLARARSFNFFTLS
jgi:parallel beta-helix repeat protein